MSTMETQWGWRGSCTSEEMRNRNEELLAWSGSGCAAGGTAGEGCSRYVAPGKRRPWWAGKWLRFAGVTGQRPGRSTGGPT